MNWFLTSKPAYEPVKVSTSSANPRHYESFSIPKIRGFKIAFLNAGTIPGHLDELRLGMQTNCFDILAINETRLDSTFNDSEIGIEGYTIVQRDRFRLGGGLAIYIRNSIHFIIQHDLSDSVLEFLCFEIRKPKVKPFLVSTWYKPPGTTIDLFDKFEVLLSRIEATGLESTIIGDFYCNMISRPFDNPTKHLIELCESFQYT